MSSHLNPVYILTRGQIDNARAFRYKERGFQQSVVSGQMCVQTHSIQNKAMNPEGQLVIYSIGHSDHTLEVFLDLLRQQGIQRVVDVRSQPYSRWVPAFNRETLARALEAAEVSYAYMGDSLGGRPADPTLYDPHDPSGRPDYARLAATETFRAGIERLIELARDRPIVIMCSEGDYRQCHRGLLITPELLARGVRVIHILPDGSAVEARPGAQQLTLF